MGTKPVDSLTPEEDIVAHKYRKMLKMNVPQEAIRQRMIMNNVDQKIISNILNVDFEGSISKFDKIKKMKKSQLIYLEKLDKKESDILLHETKEEYYNDMTDKEQEIVSRYRKMLSIGIPQEAVQHKMTKDKVSNKIFKLVLSLSNESSDKNDTKLVDSLTPEEDIVAHKYRKMLKMNVPQEAIRQRMIMNNVDQKIISNILNVDFEGSISKFDKIKKMKKSQLIYLDKLDKKESDILLHETKE